MNTPENLLISCMYMLFLDLQPCLYKLNLFAKRPILITLNYGCCQAATAIPRAAALKSTPRHFESSSIFTQCKKSKYFCSDIPLSEGAVAESVSRSISIQRK